MTDYLQKQESCLPPGYRLQVIFDDKGCPSTVPMGTTKELSYIGGLRYRERMAQELRNLMEQQYGYGYGSLMTLCYDIEGNECVVIRAKRPPPNRSLTDTPKPHSKYDDNIIDVETPPTAPPLLGSSHSEPIDL